MKYSNLFNIGKIGKLEIKNRIVMPALGAGVASADGTPGKEMIAYYSARAKGGTGLIITEITRINDDHGVGENHQLSVTTDKHIEPLGKLADAVHEYDTKLFVQLHHPGRQTFSEMIGNQPVVAPSPIPCGVCQQETRELTVDEIKSLINDFVQGAIRAKKAGVDGVELHAAHGYLIEQFLSPYTNKRTDSYGGSFENRTRFISEIISGIRENCGDYPIIVRLSVEEFLSTVGIEEKGIDLEEGVKIAKYLETIGIDAINVTSGTYETMNTFAEPISYPQGWRSHLSEAVKKEVNIPVIAANVIRKPEFAEELIANGTVDFVAMGRGLLADPDWANKVKENREGDIRYCISCLNCFETVFINGAQGKPLDCAINARACKEAQFDNLRIDGDDRIVAVVGAGPAGMESARILAERGFKPVVYEKKSAVGGQLNLANKPPKKEKLTLYIDYLENQLNKYNVEIKRNTEATIEELKTLNPYAVFVATGSSPLVPPIDGVKGEHVFTVDEILGGRVVLKDKKIAVIGSGMTGLETAELLAEQGNKVNVIEMADTIGPGAYDQNLMDVTGRLNSLEVDMLPSHQLVKILEDKIVVRNMHNDEIVEFNVDCVVLSLGVRGNTELVKDIKSNFENVKVVGDVNSIGRIAQAVKAGYTEAYNL